LLAHQNEGANDSDARFNRSRTVQYTGEHKRPCSVKTQGNLRRPPCELDIANCDIKFANSCWVS
jgi:hypothetical protein